MNVLSDRIAYQKVSVLIKEYLLKTQHKKFHC